MSDVVGAWEPQEFEARIGSCIAMLEMWGVLTETDARKARERVSVAVETRRKSITEWDAMRAVRAEGV